MNNETTPVTEELKEKRKNIEKKILGLEKYNYNQKDYTAPEMTTKLKKIIEEEMNK